MGEEVGLGVDFEMGGLSPSTNYGLAVQKFETQKIIKNDDTMSL